MSCGTDESSGANAPSGTDDREEIMAAIDRSDEASRLVIADVTRDDAWLSVCASEALALRQWR